MVLTSRLEWFLLVPWLLPCCRPQFELMVVSERMTFSKNKKDVLMFWSFDKKQLLGFLRDRFRITSEFLWRWWFLGGVPRPALRASVRHDSREQNSCRAVLHGYRSHRLPWEQCPQPCVLR